MSEPTLYQFDQELADIIWQQERTDYLPLLARALKEGVLVPVEPCEHGKIDGHEQWSKGETRAGWCDGAGIGGGDD